MLMGRCTGQCCAVFTLHESTLATVQRGEPYNAMLGNPMGDDGPLLLAMLIPLTPEEADARIERLGMTADGGGAATHWRRDFESAPNSESITVAFDNGERQISVRLRRGWIAPDAIRSGWTAYAWVRDAQWPDIRAVFACRHWNETTGRCDAYVNRPWLCRDYPGVEAICKHCGFQYPLTDRDPGDETGAEVIPSWATTW